ncbi:TPA: hypothetical protein MH419_27395 [Klebsiella pneumoniae]|nr:hypothetical protein [Klebsiella pneumoniae]HBY4307922.1 hypothetical protein [Klebsiella pneumoniae]
MNKQFRTVQITADQYEQMREIQQELARDKNMHGFVPTVHHISRVMIDRGIALYKEDMAKQAN